MKESVQRILEEYYMKYPVLESCRADIAAALEALTECYEKDGKLLVCGSGNSANVLNAIAYAKEPGVETVGFVGFSGGRLKEMADISFHVKLNNMQIVEDVHLILNHLLMYCANQCLGIADHHVC